MSELKKLHGSWCLFLLDFRQLRALHWLHWRLASKILTNLLDFGTISCMKGFLYQLALYTFLWPCWSLHFLYFFDLGQLNHKVSWALNLIVVFNRGWTNFLSHFMPLKGMLIELFYCMLRIVKSVLLWITRMYSTIFSTVMGYFRYEEMLSKPYWVESRLMDDLRLAEVRILSHLDDGCSEPLFRIV